MNSQALVDAAIEAWCAELADLGPKCTFLHVDEASIVEFEAAEDVWEAVGRTGGASFAELGQGQPSKGAEERLGAMLRHRNEVRRDGRATYLAVGVMHIKATNAADPMLAGRDLDRFGAPADVVAPYLIAPVKVEAIGAYRPSFNVSASGSPLVNPYLCQFVRNAFGVEFDQLNGHEATAALNRAMSGADLESRFEPSGLICELAAKNSSIVADLQRLGSKLVGHEVLAAIAGVPSAVTNLRVSNSSSSPISNERSLHGAVPPTWWRSVGGFGPVLPADESQTRAIAVATAGSHLVVEGPPGTGKTQTIANMAANFAGLGRSVLVVTEKAAAASAVTECLRAAHLSDLVADAHSWQASPQDLAISMRGRMRALSSSRHESANDFGQSGDAEAAVAQLLAVRDAVQATYTRLKSQASSSRRPFEQTLGLLLEQPSSSVAALAQNQNVVAVVSGQKDVLGRVINDWMSLDGAARVRAGGISKTIILGPKLPVGESPEGLDRVADCIDRTRKLLLSAPTIREDSSLATIRDICRLLESGPETLAMFQAEEGWKTPKIWASSLRLLVGVRVGEIRSTETRIRSLLGIERAARTAFRSRSGLTLAGLAEHLERLDREIQQIAAAQIDLGLVARLSSQAGFDIDACAVTRKWLSMMDLSQHPGDNWPTALAELALITDSSDAWSTVVRLQIAREVVEGAGLESLLETDDPRREFQRLIAVAELASARNTVGSAPTTGCNSAVMQDYRHADEAWRLANQAAILQACDRRAELATAAHPVSANAIQLMAVRAGTNKVGSVAEFVSSTAQLAFALLPIWVASPTSVGLLFPPTLRLFDVVIVDEASQVRPSHAVSAILRARQVIVAGDSKQLPPTNFFMPNLTVEGNPTAGIESILDVVSSVLPIEQSVIDLKWHYRSNNDALIDFVNSQPSLYSGRITCLPGPPLTKWPIDFICVNGNREIQANAVAQTVEELLVDYPKESIAVVTLGLDFANQIRELLEVRSGGRRSLSAALSSNQLSVVNVERIQGDEFDFVVFAVGMEVGEHENAANRLGPLNNSGGCRRLNVAITRSRQRMIVVNGIAPANLSSVRFSSDGAQMLVRFLKYAAANNSPTYRLERWKEIEISTEQTCNVSVTTDPLVERISTRLLHHGLSVFANQRKLALPQLAVIDQTSAVSRPVAITSDLKLFNTLDSDHEILALYESELERRGWRSFIVWSEEWLQDFDGRLEEVLKIATETSVDLSDGGQVRSGPPTQRPSIWVA